MNLENQLKVLKEQLDISQRLHHSEFLKVRRYEKVLSALLNMSCELENEAMIDIITNCLKGLELEDCYEEDYLEGLLVLGQFIEGEED